MPGKFDIQKYKPDAPCQGSLISKNLNQVHHGKIDIPPPQKKRKQKKTHTNTDASWEKAKIRQTQSIS